MRGERDLKQHATQLSGQTRTGDAAVHGQCHKPLNLQGSLSNIKQVQQSKMVNGGSHGFVNNLSDHFVSLFRNRGDETCGNNVQVGKPRFY